MKLITYITLFMLFILSSSVGISSTFDENIIAQNKIKKEKKVIKEVKKEKKVIKKKSKKEIKKQPKKKKK